MRQYAWLGSLTFLAAALAIVAIGDYVNRHPQSALARWLGTAPPAMAVPGEPTEPAPTADTGVPQPGNTPVVVIDLSGQSHIDPKMMEQLQLISGRDAEARRQEEEFIRQLQKALLGTPKFPSVDRNEPGNQTSDPFMPRRMPKAEEDEPPAAPPSSVLSPQSSVLPSRAADAVRMVSEQIAERLRKFAPPEPCDPMDVPTEKVPVLPRPVPKKGDHIARQLFQLGLDPLAGLMEGLCDGSRQVLPHPGFLLSMPRIEGEVSCNSTLPMPYPSPSSVPPPSPPTIAGSPAGVSHPPLPPPTERAPAESMTIKICKVESLPRYEFPWNYLPPVTPEGLPEFYHPPFPEDGWQLFSFASWVR